MYCSIKNSYSCIKKKLEAHTLDENDEIQFDKFKLIEIYKPTNDSVFIKQNLKTVIKDYCNEVNEIYDDDDSGN